MQIMIWAFDRHRIGSGAGRMPLASKLPNGIPDTGAADKAQIRFDYTSLWAEDGAPPGRNNCWHG